MVDSSHIEIIKKWLGSGTINIFGLPFAGKDEQTSRLVKLFGGIQMGGGDILRGSMTPEVKPYLDAGELIPSDMYVNMVLPYLSQPELSSKPLFLSSVGRWSGEENGVMRVLTDAGHPLKAVIYLVVSKDDALTRLQTSKTIGDRGDRDDDDESLLETRFSEFEQKTIPVIDHYRELGFVIEIDATGSREDVQNTILNELYKRASD